MITGRGPSRAFVLLLAVLASGVLAAGVRARLQTSHGLTAEYFAGAEWNAPRAQHLVTREVSARQVLADRDGELPPVFRARWFGYLTVVRAGEYTFPTIGGDEVGLSIDGQRVTGSVRLGRGSHFVLIEYATQGKPPEFAWAWAREGARPAAVSWHVLSPARVPYWRPILLAALDWTILISVAAVAIVSGRIAWARLGTRATHVAQRYPRAAALPLFVALAVFHTWPLASDPAHLSRNDNGDTLLNEWALAWFAHQVPRAPLQLFDANIYYPEPHTLAYSEAMIVQSVMAAPLRWLGASPVLTYNLVLVAGFVLTGWAAYIVMMRWTADAMAALTTGLLFGFNAHTLARLPHLQAQHIEFLPFAVMALDALLREPDARRAVRLAGWFSLQALTSIYLLVFTAFAMVAGALARPEWYTSRRFLKVAPHLALAGVVAVAALAPYLLPYWRLSRDPWFSRSLENAVQYSATWADYLATPGRFHFAWWSDRFWQGNGLFPGVMGALLTAVAIASGVAYRDARARMCVAIGAMSVYLSFGTRAPGYATLYEWFPLLQAIRAPVRFGHVAILAVAFLAGFGQIEIRRRVGPVAGRLLPVVALAVITFEVTASPLHLQPYSGIPAIYRLLATETDAVVVELPLPRATFVNARYMLYSTEHFRPMLNGYSGFVPRSYYTALEMLGGFPDAKSIDALRAFGVTHAFVHLDQLGATAAAGLGATPGLVRVATDGLIALFAIAPTNRPR